MTQLSGSKAVITGGAMGIGLATAKRLLDEGCQVAIWDINKEALMQAEKELKEEGDRVLFCQCDVSDEEQVYHYAQVVQNAMGQVDILINNAGMVVPGRFCQYKPSVREKETRVNLLAMYYTIYAFLPGMYERNCGHIVNISSGAGLVGMPDLAAYCASKWAVYGLTESLRFEAIVDGKTGVHFSSVHPGILKKGMFEGSKLNLLGEIMIPRVNDHDSIAGVIVNRALKKNRYIVKFPKSLHMGPLARGLMPDRMMNSIMLLAGIGDSMKNWTGSGRDQ
ncbi:Short-chain dehydrogenase/reductase SDR [Desulfatibacillum aliphaticivorans]|uniref:Short-chain dehydrogenase/reductase SDR n=1 Tax=Desulfatibacillum aliphaticivorans TaxID=218208 RepID=B8FH03_DESAL|nr:SDR family NAD(P)-dependent oxidoreductase [Desulfatibacillum aliphaticivorans]ACL02091.1 Short-chain dehydrogenase/reductase SDR [Desulfatibacillum aliphaticivorans]